MSCPDDCGLEKIRCAQDLHLQICPDFMRDLAISFHIKDSLSER